MNKLLISGGFFPLWFFIRKIFLTLFHKGHNFNPSFWNPPHHVLHMFLDFSVAPKKFPPPHLLLTANLSLTLVCASSAASRWFSQDLPAKRCEERTKCFLLSGSMWCVPLTLALPGCGGQGETSAQIYSWLVVYSILGFVFFVFWLFHPVSLQGEKVEQRTSGKENGESWEIRNIKNSL